MPGDIFPAVWLRQYDIKPEIEAENQIVSEVRTKFVLSQDERIETVG
jgi:hypothetical protein